nr:unnamed protein product [Spirometra erinaceieuropaei]
MSGCHSGGAGGTPRCRFVRRASHLSPLPPPVLSTKSRHWAQVEEEEEEEEECVQQIQRKSGITTDELSS